MDSEVKSIQLKDIIERCRHLTIIEQRCLNDEFVELVFDNGQAEAWYQILTEVLGKPRKDKGEMPSEGDLAITKRTGGIRVNQTLFEAKVDDNTIIAKFWPWNNNRYTTLRMALLIKG
ncbi:MAG: hypothetical protein HKP58_03455 [Desulfatitalea sp.]|nr:hypothetical protein [Desulfatitalea sp.]NNJ99449.1 hypothetical protein [Desulfatitalea sp.]